MQEGEGIIFSGSSQWHYRERIPKQKLQNYCHLVFFHFVPAGMCKIVSPKEWPDLFGIPELDQVLYEAGTTARYTLF